MSEAISRAKSHPSSIRIFLAEGSPTGLRIVEKSNWIGQGIVFPRSGYSEVKGRSEFGKSGVYVVGGPSEGSGRDRIYIGEGDPVRPRLDSHFTKKDFWTWGFIFISKDNNLNKAHVQYLEARLCELADSAKRVELDNGNKPERPSLSEAEQAEMDAFLAEMLVCFPVLGVTAFESPAPSTAGSRIYITKARGADAKGFESEGGFVVQAGSVLCSDEAESIPPSLSTTRKELVDAGVIAARGDQLVMTQDYVFGSPSTAAGVVLGRSANGRIEWKDKAGRTLKEIQEVAS